MCYIASQCTLSTHTITLSTPTIIYRYSSILTIIRPYLYSSILFYLCSAVVRHGGHCESDEGSSNDGHGPAGDPPSPSPIILTLSITYPMLYIPLTQSSNVFLLLLPPIR